jgi:hypothetical protein
MNDEIGLVALPIAVRERGPRAYVVTVSGDGYPHTVQAAVQWEPDGLAATVGDRTAANAAARPHISLLYPVRSDEDYSLIVDGTAVVESGAEGHRLLISPTRAVLHRPGPPRDPASSCRADCVPLLSLVPPPRSAR